MYILSLIKLPSFKSQVLLLIIILSTNSEFTNLNSKITIGFFAMLATHLQGHVKTVYHCACNKIPVGSRIFVTANISITLIWNKKVLMVIKVTQHAAW